MQKKKNNQNRDFSISVRLFDERFDEIFGLTKKNYKQGLKEIDDLLRLKLGEGIAEIIKKQKKNGRK